MRQEESVCGGCSGLCMLCDRLSIEGSQDEMCQGNVKGMRLTAEEPQQPGVSFCLKGN